MCGKGSQTTTTQSAPNPQAMAAYQDLLGRAGGVSNLPFQTYGGEFTAPLNAQQQQAGQNINQYAGFAQPYIQQAAGYANRAAQPISGSDINQYLSPYTQDVVNATQAQFNQNNQIQQNQLTGNAAAQGALGGDRVGVAQAALAGQQNLSEAPAIAGLYNQGYGQALQTALQEQQNLGQSAYSLGNLGVAGQNAGLGGANAQLGYGTLGQSTQQAQDQALYSQFLAQQGYPFQTAQWLAGIDTAVGSQMGGTSSTQGPAPNQAAQWGGLGLAALSFLNRGGGIHRDGGGRIPGFQMGGMPYAGGASYIPSMGLTMGQGAPKPPGAPGQGQQQIDPFKLASSTIDLQKKIKGLGGSGDPGLDEVTQAGAAAGLSPDELGLGEGGEESLGMFGLGGWRRGGRIAGFADGGYADGGGDNSFEDRFGGGGYDPYVDDLGRLSALNGLRKVGEAESSGSGLGLSDIMTTPLSGSRNSKPAYPPIPYSSQADLDNPSGPSDFVNPSVVNGQKQNLTGDIIPPGGSGGRPNSMEQQAPFAPVAGLAGPPVADTGGGYHPRPMSFAPTAGQPSQAPAGAEDTGGKQSGFGGILSALNNPLGLSPDMRKALMTAGFSMMASRSPYLGNAIGEGGLAGLSAYTGSQKEAFNEKKAVDTLHQQAKLAEDRIARETKRDEDTAQYRKDTLNKPPAGYERVEGGLRALPGGPADPKVIKQNQDIKKPPIAGMSPEQAEIQATQIARGNMSPLTGLPRTPQGLEVRNALRSQAAQIIMQEHPGMQPAQVADALNKAEQDFKGRQIGINSEARTAGNREANLNLILRATEAAVPAALEASDKVTRHGGPIVPLNHIIQKGEIMTSDPELVEFGMANLQLAEHWARAMNPTGVMRESDRDLALKFLDTGLSQGTYERAVMQLQKQITRERDAVRSVPPNTPINPNAPAPVPGGGTDGPAAAGPAGGATAPVGSAGAGNRPVVHNKAEYDALPSGSSFTDANGKPWTKP